jgi:hypothetical protein
MTRTEVDLRECFAERADTASDGAEMLARLGQGRRSTPRALLVAASIVAVVALASWQFGIGTPSSSSDHAGSGIDSRPSAALLDYGMRLDPVPPGYTIASRNLTATASRVVFDAARTDGTAGGTADVVEVVVYLAGAFDATSVRTGTAVSVDGVDGWYGPASGHVVNGSGVDGDAIAPSVAWEYAPGSWAVVTGTAAQFQSQAVELAIAGTVHPTSGEPVRLPFRLDHAPSGLSATHVGTRIDSPPVSASVGFGSPTAVTVDAMYVPGQPVDTALADGERRTIAGHPAAMMTLSGAGSNDGHRLVIVWNDWIVDVSGVGSVTTEELITTAEGLTLADKDDPATWFPATDALG